MDAQLIGVAICATVALAIYLNTLFWLGDKLTEYLNEPNH